MQEEIIQKIQKLEALRQRAGTEAEAANAAARIADICQKHNIDIGVAQLEREETQASESSFSTNKLQWQDYWSSLSNATCKLLNVGHYKKKQPFIKDGKYGFENVLIFYGLKASVASAVITYEYLLSSVDSILKGHNNRGLRYGRTGNNSFKQGCARRIYDEALKIQELSRAMLYGNIENAALVKLENSLLAQHRNKLNLSKAKKNRLNVDQWAYQAGYEAGGKVDIHGARSSRMLT